MMVVVLDAGLIGTSRRVIAKRLGLFGFRSWMNDALFLTVIVLLLRVYVKLLIFLL